MAGSALILPGEVTNAPFGKFHAYEGTFDSTVYLWDAGYAPLAAIPAEAAVVPNLMRDQAAQISGLTAAQCDISINNTMGNGFAAGEITTLGGIHIASTQAGAQNAPSNFTMNFSATFANWLLGQTDAGADYALLATLWLRTTRAIITADNGAPQSLMHFVSGLSPTTNRHYYHQTTTAVAGSALAAAIAAPLAGNAGIAAASSQGWNGAKPGDANNANQRVLANVGSMGAWATFNYNKAGSHIIYRAQLDLVDLSDVAGADRLAKCNAMTAALQTQSTRDFAAGGRFHGDTFTAAATLKA